MIPDAEIWRAAMAMVKRFGEDALLEAAARADQLQEDGDWQGALIWQRIPDAIERLREGQLKGRRCTERAIPSGGVSFCGAWLRF